MNQKKNERHVERKAKSSTKKDYKRPEVVKHGNVESLTKTTDCTPSCPIQLKLPL